MPILRPSYQVGELPSTNPLPVSSIPTIGRDKDGNFWIGDPDTPDRADALYDFQVSTDPQRFTLTNSQGFFGLLEYNKNEIFVMGNNNNGTNTSSLQLKPDEALFSSVDDLTVKNAAGDFILSANTTWLRCEGNYLLLNGRPHQNEFTAFTPSITQDATDATAMTFSSNSSRWRKTGEGIEVFLAGTFNSGGTVANAINFDLPADLTVSSALVGGSAIFRDTGTGVYHCYVEGTSITNDTARFIVHDPASSGVLGTDLAYTIASGDKIRAHLYFFDDS